MTAENGTAHAPSTRNNSPAPRRESCLVRMIKKAAACLLRILAAPFLLVLVFFCMIFLAAPCLYFGLRYFLYQDEELAQLFREKGYTVDSRIVNRWVVQTKGSYGNTSNTFYVVVAYHADGNQYSKKLVVSRDNYTRHRLELTVLRGYPRSAIVEGFYKRSKSEYFIVVAFAIIWSFGWTCGWFYGVLYGAILSSFLDKGLAFAVASLAIIVCWTIGYFVARREIASGVRHTLNGAELVQGTGEVHVQAQDSDYSTLLSKDTALNRVFDILKTLVSEFLLLVFGLISCAIVIAYMGLFGMYFYIMNLIIVNRLGLFRLFDKQYAVSGHRIQGQIVEREPPSSVKVRYSPFIGSPMLYEKTFKTALRYGRVCCCKNENGDNRRLVRIPFPESDTIELFILPHNPRSAWPAVEIENRGAIHRIPTWGLIVFEVIFVAFYTILQTVVGVFFLRQLLFPTHLPLVLTCYVLLGLSLSCVVAIILRKKREHDIRNGAQEVERQTEILNSTEEGVDIELAGGHETGTRETVALERESEIRQL
mmetsp:Transcript_26789/g.50557  ORF Transcript_26789/g.50557 Transcript_26789/m.50557 type:complete len:536 (+) Transcript_26789:171-1778(+)